MKPATWNGLQYFLAFETGDRDHAAVIHPESEKRNVKTSPFNATRIAVENLRSQLGISSSGSDPCSFFSHHFNCFSLFKKSLQRRFWRNRNVLEVSLHINNMLARSADAQYRFMNKKKKETEKRISDALDGLGISGLKELYSPREVSVIEIPGAGASETGQFVVSKGNETKKRITSSSKCLISNPETSINEDSAFDTSPDSGVLSPEAELFLFHLMGDDLVFALVEQRMTFLGCSMEGVVGGAEPTR